MSEVELTQILTAVVGSVLYSITFFIKEHESKIDENFEPKKFLATLIVGIGVGLGFTLSGQSLEFAQFHEEMLMYAGTVAIVESLLKTVYRNYIK